MQIRNITKGRLQKGRKYTKPNSNNYRISDRKYEIQSRIENRPKNNDRIGLGQVEKCNFSVH